MGTGQLFYVFLRQNKELMLDFSIGLQLKQPEELILTRYNGIHGRHQNPDGRIIEKQHIHLLRQSELQEGTTWPRFADETHRYTTYEQAQLAFMQDVNIKNWSAHFPNLKKLEAQLQVTPLFPVSSNDDA